jgi:hypothetical protein
MPVLGQPVVYVASDYEAHINGSREHAAIVTRVWSELLVNLQVLYDFGPIAIRGSVSKLGHQTSGCPAWRELESVSATGAPAP